MDLTIFILSASDADLTGTSQSDGSEGGSDGAERSVPAEGSGQAEGSNRAAGSEEGGNSQATLPLLVQVNLADSMVLVDVLQGPTAEALATRPRL